MLLVDDDPTMRLIWRRLLGREAPGVELVESESGEGARAALREQEFDVIVSDFRMGATSGIDVLAFAFERHPRAARVLMSGFSDPRVVERARAEARIDAFVEKPVAPEELVATLRCSIVEPFLLGGRRDTAGQDASRA